MLSFELSDSGKSITVYFDEKGAKIFNEALELAKKNGHFHLLSPSCGGNELNEVNPFGKESIGEVILSNIS